MIVIKDYDPQWVIEFEAIRAALSELLGARVAQNDHIGSTSVPGLGAKDVIEIIKRTLAQHHTDYIEAYSDIKDPVYDLIWEAAQEWAKYTNWKPDL